MRRRSFLGGLSAGPAILRAWETRADHPAAVQSGDVTADAAVVWARTDRASRLTVEWRSTQGATGNTRTFRGPEVSEETDFTGRVYLTGLPPGQRIFYEARFEEIGSKKVSEPMRGSFQTAPGGNVRFLWSGDMVGQGWGINPDWGGIRIYEAMRRREPHFFLHSGDTIYADGPIVPEVKLADGSVWKNIVTPAKSKASETLDEFRGCYRYNLLDGNVRRFSAEVGQLWQWDDHEVTNNWSPSKDLAADPKYTVKDVNTLVGRARQAFLEYAPMRQTGTRIYRKVSYGPLVDVFLIDMRSYRGPNSENRQAFLSSDTALLGARQIDWLKRDVRNSRAAWKIIASDMPLGVVVGDGPGKFEAVANNDGPALGRELEIAALLSDWKRNSVRNTVWLTADVHYTAAHFYDPAKAQYTDFGPFWEFISGPLHAGTFGPGRLDNTFGPQVVFEKAPPKGQSNLPPSAGLQFFGEVEANAKTRELTVTLRDLTGAALFAKTIPQERS